MVDIWSKNTFVCLCRVFCRGIRGVSNIRLSEIMRIRAESSLAIVFFFVFQFNHKKLKPKMIRTDSDSYSYCSYTVLENLELARPLA